MSIEQEGFVPTELEPSDLKTITDMVFVIARLRQLPPNSDLGKVASGNDVIDLKVFVPPYKEAEEKQAIALMKQNIKLAEAFINQASNEASMIEQSKG
ncbi:MAG: hypothetical protein AAB657_01145 [Patescibacteria group bacterium]